MRTHKDLLVWQKSIDVVSSVYKLTSGFPHSEILGITSQMRRAAVSVPSNIAEGYGRLYNKETLKFISNALGSATELETQLIISDNLGFADSQAIKDVQSLNNEVIRMLTSLKDTFVIEK